MKANWEISITYNAKILKREKSPPAIYKTNRWAFFFVYRNDYLNDIGSAGSCFICKKEVRKNAILKGMNLEEDATGTQRNNQIGGHRA